VVVVSGAELICAETVMNPMQFYNAEQQLDSEDEIKFLFTIRSRQVYYSLVDGIIHS